MTVPAVIDFPISDRLRRWLAAVDAGAAGPLDDAIGPEASALLESMQARRECVLQLTKPAAVEWLEDVAAAVKNPPSDDELVNRAGVLVAACGFDFPAYMFNLRSQQVAMRSFEFWPSVKEVIELVYSIDSDEMCGLLIKLNDRVREYRNRRRAIA